MHNYELLASYENAMISLDEFRAALEGIRRQRPRPADVVIDCGDFQLRITPS
jgi:hypothetical protein